IAGELKPRGVRKTLTLARYRRLENATREQPDVTQHHDSESKHHQGVRIAAVARRNLHDHSPDQADDEQPEHPSHELHVEAHVTIENVTELMADDPLQLVAGQVI